MRRERRELAVWVALRFGKYISELPERIKGRRNLSLYYWSGVRPESNQFSSFSEGALDYVISVHTQLALRRLLSGHAPSIGPVNEFSLALVRW